MATLTFYEKPGCQGNARQKALLRAAGHQLHVRNLLTEPWTPERLRQFFGALPVAQWFNRNAPAVKSGEVNPDAMALLRKLGYPPGPVDNLFGRQTAAAIRRFQLDHKLPPTGVLTAETWGAIVGQLTAP